MREYVVLRTRSGGDNWDAKGTDYLARTIHESDELVDIGVLDAAGKKVMARRRMDQIGFVRRNGSPA